MSDAIAVSSGEEIWRPKGNPWVIAVAVSLAAFMEVLDTSIANVALPHIAGNLGASNDESTWVLTSYLVSNAIVLPISGWLVTWLGRKRFFLTCIVFFTISSFLCGIAPNLGLLLLFRVLQGAFGGGLQPMAQAILGDTFPPRSEDWRLLCMESRPSARLLLVQRWEDGSLTTTLGAGFSTSTFQLALWRSPWSIALSKIHRTWHVWESGAPASTSSDFLS